MSRGAARPSSASAVEASEELSLTRIRSQTQIVWYYIYKDKIALIGAFIVLCLVFVSVFAPVLAPHDPTMQYMEGLTEYGSPIAPGEDTLYALGTDALGRDVISRMIFGARSSLIVGILGSLLTMVLGVGVGAIAGYLRKGGNEIMRGVDVLMSIPSLLLAIALVSVLRPSIWVLIFVIAVISWTYLARIVYGEVLSIREFDFILAARSIGVPPARIIIRHVLPQVLPLVIVYATLGISTTIRLEATLSFLGLGIQPPMPSWGGMMQLGQSYFRTAPWLVIFPGLAVTITVLGFNLLGDGLRDALDPKRQR